MMSPLTPRAFALWTLLLSLLLNACSTTSLDGSWTRPEVVGKRLQGPVMVVGVARDDTVRRVYEDEMVGRLTTRGVKAQRSYELLPEALTKDAVERLQQAARKAGATHILSTAVIGQERETVVHQDPFVYGGWGGYRGWYGSYWGMAYPVYTDVRTYTIYKETRAFIDIIVGALEAAGLVNAAPK
jgi:hypothetical protein